MVAQLTLSGWRVLADPPGEPQANMDKDEELTRRVRSGAVPPTLRIYGWSWPAVSLGRSQNPDDLRTATWRQNPFRCQVARTMCPVPGTGVLPVVRRPTGGGAVLHTTDEVTYAVALPGSVIPQAVRLKGIPGLIHRSLRDILIADGLLVADDLSVAPCNSAGTFTFCFQAPARGDLLYQGRKVAGSALRAWRDGVLVQGSIQGLPVPHGPLVRSLSAAVSAAFPGW